MEEILASIRRIIADDQSLPAHGRGPAALAVEGLAEAIGDPKMNVAGPATYSPVDAVAPRPASGNAAAEPARTGGAMMPLEGHGPIAAAQIVEEPEAKRTTGPAAVPGPGDGETNPQSDAPSGLGRPADWVAKKEEAMPDPAPELAVDSASLFSEATDHSVTAAFNVLAASRIADHSDELLQLVRGMVRPLLRAWIDENLPGMVEQMIRAEIERMTRGGR